MKEITKNILKKWGAKLKRSIDNMGESKVSLDPLNSYLGNGDIDGAIGELQKLRKVRKKMKKDQ